MKRYKLKVDSPWGKKGDVFEANTGGVLVILGALYDPDRYPDLFEEIVLTDEEFLANWLYQRQAEFVFTGDKTEFVSTYNCFLSNRLIANGFDVKKLREKNEKKESL